ncbi:hypothetical protein FE783_12290 [Paenibacillus mesophilus]|uniref:hypothetical protein n=1 Tax=Paenibacillus mesophilus TaxID=2582849 RepID=UPI00110D2F10|nr:hypothetical protein [Paenibacillus mesophilus]TMV50324.1 hypothetical protein FE783_12290 [Paenibacillus mesophilus]
MTKLLETKQEIERLIYNRNLAMEIHNGTLHLRDLETNEVLLMEITRVNRNISTSKNPLVLIAVFLLIFLATVGVVHFISSQ